MKESLKKPTAEEIEKRQIRKLLEIPIPSNSSDFHAKLNRIPSLLQQRQVSRRKPLLFRLASPTFPIFAAAILLFVISLSEYFRQGSEVLGWNLFEVADISLDEDQDLGRLYLEEILVENTPDYFSE